MPTRQRELWEDWFPGADREPQVTIDELVSELAKTNPDVTPTQIRYWQRIGVLPMPLRRRHGNATMALYPLDKARSVIALGLEQQKHGYSLEQIRRNLRAAAMSLRDTDPLDIEDEITAIGRAYERKTGRVATVIDLRVTNTAGKEDVFVYPVAPTTSMTIDLIDARHRNNL